MKATWVSAAIIVLAVAFILPAYAKEKKEGDRPGGAVVETKSITATVEAIDYKTRMVTLRGPGGDVVTLKVGPGAKNLDKVKKGDKVTFDYYASVAVDVRKSAGEPMAGETQSMKGAKPGEKPGGTIETTGYITAKVEDIDYKSRMITLRMPGGDAMILKAGDQVTRLNEIKKGDEVVIQYTQAVAISVHTP